MLTNRAFNILHVISSLPIGGVENMLLKVVTGYDKNLFNVTICCLKDGGAIADELKRSGYKVEVLNKMRSHRFDIETVTALIKVIKKENIHILRTHQYHANLYGRIAGILAGVPVMVPSFHSLYNTSPKGPKLHRRILNHILSWFSYRLVAVSNTVASDMIRFDKVSPERVVIINNGISIDIFEIDITKEEARKIWNIPLSTFIVGSVGRLKEEKGHRLLIEAVSRLSNVSLAIAGDGPLMEELTNLARQLKIHCIFIGQLSPEKIPLFLRSLDIFCFPSVEEGFGVALVEAMASGLPIIASDIPSHREVIGDVGILAPVKDANALAEKLKMLIRDTTLRESFSQKAVERAKMFSIDRTVKAYEELFEDALRQKGFL